MAASGQIGDVLALGSPRVLGLPFAQCPHVWAKG